ncbi:glutamate receptor ionotropic, kainate 2 [Folsomia candida]|uniref:Glutamate receptor ionotropic, kainate 3 n=1 Tax=Folsomia candida TaxID=158441 RepID=A0A226E6Z5_FOLCA|nr:glutamate receptor ionotropic, kainate 2 [Folsomia candida]OXA53118.1 Glutamate receptor ionotropic, kainate 3 [Folsomia candida]
MIPFLLAIGCLTGYQKNCPNPTPVMDYQLKSIWSPTNPYDAKQYEKGYWTMNTTHRVDMRKLIGQKIRVAMVNEAPFVEKLISAQNGSFEGVGRTILGVLREFLGINWELVFPDDNEVGYVGDDGKPRGLIKMILEDKADIALTYMSQIHTRVEHVEFSKPFGEEQWHIMMSRPRETTDGDGLVAPFQTEVWYCLMVSLLLMGPLCWGLIKFRCYMCKGHPTLAAPSTLGSCIWFVYGALMKQGSVLKPIADSTRILFATWWIFVTILTAFYTANLTAYLTLSKVPIPYDNLEKIGYRSYWIARKGDTIESVAKAGTTNNRTLGKTGYWWPEFEKVRFKYESYGEFMDDYPKMIEMVRRKRYLLLDEKSRIERIIYKDFRAQSEMNTPLYKRCAFIMSRKPILRVPYGFAFPVNSTYRPIFEPIMEKLTKAGLFDYWKRKDLPVRDPCSADSDFRERQLRNGDLASTYILCGSGYLLAFVSFIFEVLSKLIFNRKLQGQLVPAEKPLGFYKGNLSVSGASTFFDTDKFLKNINGRDYVVMKTPDGRTRLVPKQDGLQALQPVYNPPPPISYGYMS